jgi:hypothetical protein
MIMRSERASYTDDGCAARVTITDALMMSKAPDVDTAPTTAGVRHDSDDDVVGNVDDVTEAVRSSALGISCRKKDQLASFDCAIN